MKNAEKNKNDHDKGYTVLKYVSRYKWEIEFIFLAFAFEKLVSVCIGTERLV